MTGHLEIEPLALQHVEQIFDALDFDSIYEFINSSPRPRDVGQMVARIKRLNAGPNPKSGQRWFNFTMFLNAEVIGQLQATVVGSSAEIGYVLSPLFSGKGYATTGVRWLMEHLSMTGQIAEFWASVDPRNLKSIQLLRRCGFTETSLPTQGLLSYEPGDAIFQLRRSMAS